MLIPLDMYMGRANARLNGVERVLGPSSPSLHLSAKRTAGVNVTGYTYDEGRTISINGNMSGRNKC